MEHTYDAATNAMTAIDVKRSSWDRDGVRRISVHGPSRAKTSLLIFRLIDVHHCGAHRPD